MALPNANDRKVCDKLLQLASENGLDVEGGGSAGRLHVLGVERL